MSISQKQMARLMAIRMAMDDAGRLLNDEQAQQVIDLYREWRTDEAVEGSDVRRDGDSLYRCIQPHTTQSGWPPSTTPALWARLFLEEWPNWAQPLGTHDAYAKNAKVSHAGKRWISEMDNNTWEPGVYGWKLAEEA